MRTGFIRRWVTSAWAAVGVLFLVSQLAAAQSSVAGSIAGTAKDETGAALPGVTVEVASPALIEKVRSAVTDGQGNYKLTELRPGVYSVSFTLAGFSVYKREGFDPDEHERLSHENWRRYREQTLEVGAAFAQQALSYARRG